MENIIPKNIKTNVTIPGIYGEVYCSLTYENNKPSFLTLSQHRKDENGKEQYHTIPLFLTDLNKLIFLLKENKII